MLRRSEGKSVAAERVNDLTIARCSTLLRFPPATRTRATPTSVQSYTSRHAPHFYRARGCVGVALREPFRRAFLHSGKFSLSEISRWGPVCLRAGRRAPAGTTPSPSSDVRNYAPRRRGSGLPMTTRCRWTGPHEGGPARLSAVRGRAHPHSHTPRV